MKSLSLLAIVLAVAACQGAEVAERLAAQDRSISSIVVDVIENGKLKMVDGWPQHGIPPMAPLRFSHKDFNYVTGDFRAIGEVNDVEINGLNEFDIIIMDVSVLFSRVKFEFLFKSLNVTTQYKADVGTGHHVARDGGAFLALEDLKVYGHIKYATGLVSGNSNLRIKEIKINIVVGNVNSNIENLSKYRILNRKLNEVVEEFITLTINENSELAANWIDNTLTPICNDLIGDRSIKDLLALIGGGGGGT